MRKLILIAAMVLASAAAQAGDSRSLSLSIDVSAPPPTLKPVASTPAVAGAPQPSDAAPAAETPKAVEAVETPKFIERPALVEPKAEPVQVQQSTTAPAKPAAQKTASTHRTEKRYHKRYWTVGRIIGELHRHGIYW
jgi:hypothetical protein